MLGHLLSLISPKKLTHKGISLFTLWDSNTEIIKITAISRFAKWNNLKNVRYFHYKYRRVA